MGHVLSEPVTDKNSDSNSDEHLSYGSSGMQGWRVTMEDAHSTILELEGLKMTSFFGVYDGHGGQNVAKFAGANTHKILAEHPEFKDASYPLALQEAFLGTDTAIRADPTLSNESSGCTAVAVLVTPDRRVLCANAGDSRAILVSKGVAIPLSFDHKPTNEGESARIVSAGGFVQFGRVNGNLALSRAIGDFEFKNNSNLQPKDQIVTAFPDVHERKIIADDEFMVLACDGIWDVLSNQDVADFVRPKLAAGMALDKVCEELMDRCLATDSISVGVGCDNMTVVIVAFHHPEGGGLEATRRLCSRPKETNQNLLVQATFCK
eukprot:Lithocolla_globosa_v1_NODE_6129_length_1129_cov_192.183844.p1 type:complete len:321 gc:universal NODE_6129_length_1129_cov_192.183844:149-1111(+)